MRLRLLLGLLLTALVALPVLAQEDRGEQGGDEAELALGPDVATTVGPPAGPPLSGGPLDERTDHLAHVMRCPVCQGLSIADSPSESSRNMKRQVRAMIAAGYDDDQILMYFETAYGEFVRMVPKPIGFNLLAWIIPGLGLLGGLFLVGRTVRRGKDAAQADALPATARQAARSTGDEDLDPWLDQVRQELSGDE
ncbi:MAG: cytochrome c-type biogenesis protein CcmH [Deltaproteobacteria bacterium]|nr:cytochrome c-type biogenesis protein CcmH [Deltaproteobacteria bacterium]